MTIYPGTECNGVTAFDTLYSLAVLLGMLARSKFVIICLIAATANVTYHFYCLLWE